MKGMVLVDNRGYLDFVLWLHYGIVDVGDCLFFFDERVEMIHHSSAKEVWKSAQLIESRCVGVLFSNYYETR